MKALKKLELKKATTSPLSVRHRSQKTGKYKLSRRALMPKPEGYVERERRPRREDRGERRPRREGNNDQHNNQQ